MAISEYTPIGSRFGRLQVTGAPVKGNHYQYQVLCRCDCGIEKVVNISNLISDHTKSCGCGKYLGTPTHGHTRGLKASKTYSTYRDMITRCCNPNYREFYLYGGRGITVCKSWLKFENFLRDMGEKPEHLTLDRINSNEGYSKENCRWASVVEQANNKRNNVFIEYMGKRQTITQWAKELNIPAHPMYYKAAKGYSAEQIFSPDEK